MLEHPILMVAQATTGARLAMGKGNSGHNQQPPVLPSAAPVLYSAPVSVNRTGIICSMTLCSCGFCPDG